jgi:mono/diheme cytochrome c family protein
MTEDRTGRELTPRPSEPEGVVAPREPVVPGPVQPAGERFSAGEQAHTVGLTEERAAEVVKQSSSARYVAFLFVLIFVLFIPVYWLYAIGLPVIGVRGQMEKEVDQQYITDVSRGYALYLANCARCHDSPSQPEGNGLGNVGPPLNDQAKLYRALTDQGLPGTGHLNPDYLHAVLEVGGRFVCGDPNSVMPAWLEPKGPLNYREVEEIITFILATQDTTFNYRPLHAEGDATLPPPVEVNGWRDPTWTPAPGATPVPACWRAPAGGGTAPTAAPVESPGTPENPRVIEIEGTGSLSWIDPSTDAPLSSITLVAGETVEFHVINESGIPHNLHIGSESELAAAPGDNDLPGVDTFPPPEGPQTFQYVVENVPDQPQFACTVPGHYTTMNGDFVIQEGAGAPSGSEEPAGTAEPGASPAASPDASAAPAASPAPSAAP